MDLLTQLNNAIHYIEMNICNDIALADVSKVTLYSSYHFGRLFYYIAEMPLSEYIRKRKLSLAATEIQGSQIKIIDLAVKYGYDNADSFTRAFVKQHGITPTAARETGSILKIFLPLSFQIKIKGVQEMNCRIEKKSSFEVFGIERIFESHDLDEIPKFWEVSLLDGSRLALPEPLGLVGYSNCGQNKVPYMICSFKETNSNTNGYKVVEIPSLNWAIFRAEGMNDHGGNECQINELFNRAYSEWLPTSGYMKADGPDMELYGNNYEEIWIPIVKANNV